jgi:hypothetical protein
MIKDNVIKAFRAAGKTSCAIAFFNYFTWALKLPKKACYDMDEVMESMEYRKACTFENHYLNVYYWFKRNFDFIWKPCILRGYLKRAYQRCTRGWSDRDCWSLDYTIAKFALPRLIVLKEMMHGVPNTMFEPLPEGKYDPDKEQMAAAEKKWNETLDEIIFAMDYVANGREYGYYPKKTWPEKTTKEDYKELHAVEERVQKGLVLFGTHFRSLWD